MAVNYEQYINDIYDANQRKQEAALKQNYDANISNLQAEQTAAQKQTDANLNRTYVESQKAQKAWGEQQNAAGLSSGAMAQSDLARDTQLQADLTALRGIQQQSDADVERRRSLLSQQYSSQLQEAAASGDVDRMKALYEAAKAEDDKLYAQKEAAGKLMANKVGDYSLLGELYGLTPAQIAQLNFKPAAVTKSSGGGGYTPVPVGDQGDKKNKTNTTNVTIDDLWNAYNSQPYSTQKTQIRSPQGLTSMLVGGK